MKRILMVCEGQTERDFVQSCLGPYIQEKTLYGGTLVPTMLITSIGAERGQGGHAHQYKYIEHAVKTALKDRDAVAVTTMLDVFHAPADSPWASIPKTADPITWVASLESAFARTINDPRFVPYLSLYEFEALLFSAPEVLGARVPSLAGSVAEIKALVAARGSPEHVNDGKETAPAKRLEAWSCDPDNKVQYKKVIDGNAVSEAIGIETMRRECKHFDQWVCKLLQRITPGTRCKSACEPAKCPSLSR
ncbi:MAG: DUF4276 family protein [Deltaproteobacteria bacterium]|nr:DUF4276 family protein [Deltaproteobacteria bacterium]